jgi:hypothetical protein
MRSPQPSTWAYSPVSIKHSSSTATSTDQYELDPESLAVSLCLYVSFLDWADTRKDGYGWLLDALAAKALRALFMTSAILGKLKAFEGVELMPGLPLDSVSTPFRTVIHILGRMWDHNMLRAVLNGLAPEQLEGVRARDLDTRFMRGALRWRSTLEQTDIDTPPRRGDRCNHCGVCAVTDGHSPIISDPVIVFEISGQARALPEMLRSPLLRSSGAVPETSLASRWRESQGGLSSTRGPSRRHDG